MKKFGLLVAVLGIVVLGFLSWVLLSKQPVGTAIADRHAVADSGGNDAEGLGFGAGDVATAPPATRRAASSGVTIVTYAPPPVWATRNIHDLPLGMILDYAVEVVQYDDDRSRGTALPRNSKNQAPFVTVTPAEGVWGMSRATMGEGHIVARIQSDGDYADLGLASGLNFLWVGNDPDGNMEWVLVPGTAFAPLKDLSETEARSIFNQHAEVSSIPVSIRDF